MEGYFLGNDEDRIMCPTFIRTQRGRNCVPPLDQGFKVGSSSVHFKRNAAMLVDAIRKVL
eukprot:m.178082 g.178082  ORF g.178082 m.178082 type:complete len:60 (+) comp24505_c0_seq6:2652-2831(+)